MAKRKQHFSGDKWFALLLLIAAITAHATDFGDLRITVENLSPGTHEHGYIEYRATITNRSQQQSHRVTLRMPATLQDANSSDVLRSLTRTVEVAPQATVTVSLLKPPMDVMGSGVAVAIDGIWQTETMALVSSTFERELYSGGRYGYSGHALMSPGVKKGGAESQAENALPGNSFDLIALENPFNEWSRNWLAYSSYDGVLVTGTEWRAAPEAVREALLRYVECGGTLLIFGKWDAPAIWKANKEVTAWQKEGVYHPKENEAEAATAEEGQATPTPTPAPTPVPLKSTNDLEQHFIGFGVVMATGEQPSPVLTAAQWQAAAEHWSRSRHGTDYAYDNTDYLVGNVATPVRGLFVLMFGFVLVIGPLNWWLLKRWRKRLWLLWTVPAISLLTCLAVFGYALVSEGFQGYEGIRSLTLLDETTRRATTLGFAGYYAPFTPSTGLHFGAQTELSLNRPYAYYYRRNRGLFATLDWTTDQHLAAGWMAARVPTYFRIRKSETRRERLTVTPQADGSVQVVNGLGAPITSLVYANERGVLLEAASTIPAGASASLKATERKLEEPSGRNKLRDPLRDYRSENIFFIQDMPERYLREGHYLAALDGAPFIEQGLPNIRERRARTLVYGIPAQQ